jgi:hypothetical protein
MGYIFRLHNADREGEIAIEARAEEYPSNESIEDTLRHFQIDDYNSDDFTQNLFDVRSSIEDCDYVVSIYKENESDPYEDLAKKCQKARERLQKFVVRPEEHTPQKKTEKQKVLEEAATELTSEGCLSIYPNDIEDLYEDGMNAEDIVKRFNKRSTWL